MPSRASHEVIGSPDIGNVLFKRHKTLPHPREERRSNIYQYIPAERPRTLSINTEVASLPGSSDTSSPRTLKHPSRKIGAPDLPPTPPAHSRQSSANHNTKKLASRVASGVAAPSLPSTPVTQNSPPTPDVTPPGPPRNKPPLAFRPTILHSSSNSRTDSFKTARETPYSSDDDEVSTVRPGLLSARPSENEVPRMAERNQNRKEVGLGLGLESEEGTRTPRASQTEFVVFDGEWGSAVDEACEVEREWDDNLMRNVTVRKRPGRNSYMLSDGPRDEVVEGDIVSPTAATKVIRGLPLQERIARYRSDRSERDNKSLKGTILWPASTPNSEFSSNNSDLRRQSAMSANSLSSTVIEAMVLEGPPSRRRTLRHTKKYNGLRAFSDQSIGSSALSSVVSNETQHTLTHNTSRIPKRRHRSLASNTTVASTSSQSSNDKSRREIIKNGGIPVVIIPHRGSSTKSSKAPSLRSTSSRKTKRSQSLSSAPLSQSSKFNDPGYTLPISKKRTMSESVGSERTIDFPPEIPTRRSSLSAPTSRNTSRAGSLTAESLKNHDMLQQKNMADSKSAPDQAQSSVESHKDISLGSRLDVDHNGDPFFGTRQTTQITPFSQASYETACTTAEVQEAMAVTLFPHQNTSLLMVEQQGASMDPTPPKIITSQPEIDVNGVGQATPPRPSHPMDEVDSPLRNPRAPPELPALNFIPPTPAALTPGHEEEKQLGYDEDRPSTSTTTDSKTKRGLSLMRRAFSNRRRNSEPVVPGSGLIKRTFSLSGRRKTSTEGSTSTANSNSLSLYPSVDDRPADVSKLHPFWRPAHFWDDLEDHDNADDDEFGGRYPIIDNRPAPPKRNLSGTLKRTFAILPIKNEDGTYETYDADRRTMHRSESGRLRVMKQRSNSSLRRVAVNQKNYSEDRVSPEERFGYGFKEGNGGRVHTIPGLGVRVEYVGWSNMKRKMSEKRRQERSDKLRGTISGPKVVRSGIDDVLRTRTRV